MEVGLLARTEDAGHRQYVLTQDALDLWPTVFALAQWGEAQTSPRGPRRLFEHDGCGGAVRRAGRCATCGATPAPGELVTRPGPGAASPPLRDDPVSQALQDPHRLLEPLQVR